LLTVPVSCQYQVKCCGGIHQPLALALPAINTAAASATSTVTAMAATRTVLSTLIVG
jgi:hypothetical protein